MADLRGPTLPDTPAIAESIPASVPASVPESIPELLASTTADLGLSVDAAGQVRITESGTVIPTLAGDVVVVGAVDVANLGAGQMGGDAVVVGDRVALIDQARITASGDTAGGTVLLGGNYQGQGNHCNCVRPDRRYVNS